MTHISRLIYRYVLYGVIGHRGTSEGGHYYTYIRKDRHNWFKCDDQNITKVEKAEVFESGEDAYLLFYHKEIITFSDFDLTTGLNERERLTASPNSND